MEGRRWVRGKQVGSVEGALGLTEPCIFPAPPQQNETPLPGSYQVTKALPSGRSSPGQHRGTGRAGLR